MLIAVLTTITLIGTAGITALPAAASSEPYGAIVYSKSHNSIWHTFGFNKLNTQYKALDNCLKTGANDCDAAVWVHSGWMAIAVASNRAMGTGWGPTQDRAIYWAKQTAQRYGANDFAHVFAWNANARGTATGGDGVRIVSPPHLEVELNQVKDIGEAETCLGEVATLPLPVTFLVSPSCENTLARGGVNLVMLIACLNVQSCREQVMRHPFFP